MRLNNLKDSAFTRIGNSYEHYINPEHFLGRTAFEDVMVKPRVNVIESKNQYLITVTLPGIKKKELRVNLEGHILRVDHHEKGKEPKTLLQTDIFMRFGLSKMVDMEGITARHKNGMLRITLPKIINEESPRVIKVA